MVAAVRERGDMTEKERFMRRFNERRKHDGLTDMKFMVDKAHELSEEEFFRCANEFEAAAEQGVEVDLDAFEEVEPSVPKFLS